MVPFSRVNLFFWFFTVASWLRSCFCFFGKGRTDSLSAAVDTFSHFAVNKPYFCRCKTSNFNLRLPSSIFFSKVVHLLTSQIQTVAALRCLTMPQLVLAAEITCEFLNWVVFPFLHLVFFSFFVLFCHCLTLFQILLLISLHSLTAWTLCCAYCSVTHLSSFYS